VIRLRSYTSTFVFGLRNLHARTSSTMATWTLAGIAGLSTLLYWLAFVKPYNLLALHQRPLLNLYKLSAEMPSAPWLLLIAFLGQGALYWLGWRAAQRAQGKVAWLVILGGTLVSGGLLVWMYPFDAADVFDNIMHGRILVVYGANPFQQVAKNFQRDPFYAYVAWRRSVSAYGPGWELLAGLTARLVEDSIVASVVAFKLVAGLFLLASIGLVAAILKKMAPERALAGVVLLAWNPLILYETLGNGHNDMAMVFWILAAAWLLLSRRYMLAMLALVSGALFKFIPVLMLPVAGLIAWRDISTRPARWRFLITTTAAAVLLIWLAYWPFWRGPGVLSIERRSRLYTTSIPAVVYVLLKPELGRETAARSVSLAAAGITGLFALWQGRQAWRNRSWLSFPQASFNILMFYLLLTCLWFQQWYALWPLGLAALLPPGHAARLAALFGYTALSKQLIFEPLFLWMRPLPPQSWRELRLGPTVLSFPWLYVLLAWWHTRHLHCKASSGSDPNHSFKQVTNHQVSYE
jgi:hypothetical protein